VSNIFSIIRVFRTVRIIRFLYELKRVKFLKSLQIIMETLYTSVPTIASVALLAGIFLYVCAVAAVYLYGDIDPKRFGSLGKAIVRLFQVITLDRWSEIYTDNKVAAPSTWYLGFVLIIAETFVFEK
jgi:voltage-gated sodium channel